MKNLLTCIVILLSGQLTDEFPRITKVKSNVSSENIFIITLDGFRWQEVFTGADSTLISDERYTPDATTMKMLFWSPDVQGRRKKLLPFFWNVIASKGQLYGNRYLDSKVNSCNLYSISYPGYNEIFTGNTDITISSNYINPNPNINVLEYLNSREPFKGKVAAFTSWNVFPYILNKKRSDIFLNSGYSDVDDDDNPEQKWINRVQDDAIPEKDATRHDLLTYVTAKEYIRTHQPRIVYLGLGETDKAAHDARYDLYLEKATEADRMIGELWHWVQTTPEYKDKTTFLITTDHGRGNKNMWPEHGIFTRGSSQTWLAVIGPSINGMGEMKQSGQLYQKNIAQTIASLVGEDFSAEQPVAHAISFE